MTRRNKNLGEWGEQKASQFLLRNGFSIIARNYYTNVGEIDIIALKGGDYYFIEVKTRYHGALANNLAITDKKRFNLAKAIKIYCYKHNIKNASIITAGLMVIVYKSQQCLKFNFFVLY